MVLFLCYGFKCLYICSYTVGFCETIKQVLPDSFQLRIVLLLQNNWFFYLNLCSYFLQWRANLFVIVFSKTDSLEIKWSSFSYNGPCFLRVKRCKRNCCCLWVLVVTKMFNDFDAKKCARYSQLFVATDLVISRTQCSVCGNITTFVVFFVKRRKQTPFNCTF